MAPKRAVVFIDGSWLVHSVGKIEKRSIHEFDFRVFDQLIEDQLKSLGAHQLVGRHWFAGVKANATLEQLRVEDEYSRLLWRLEYQHNYTVHRVYQYPNDKIEKGLDTAMTAEMCVHAMLPNLSEKFDTAVVVTGDLDLRRPMEILRVLGKSVMHVSIYGACNQRFMNPSSGILPSDKLVLLNQLGVTLFEPKTQPESWPQVVPFTGHS